MVSDDVFAEVVDELLDVAAEPERWKIYRAIGLRRDYRLGGGAPGQSLDDERDALVSHLNGMGVAELAAEPGWAGHPNRLDPPMRSAQDLSGSFART
jgi:hypothetical protein